MTDIVPAAAGVVDDKEFDAVKQARGFFGQRAGTVYSEWKDTTGGADSKHWRAEVSSSTFKIVTANDANDTTATAHVITRSGNSVTKHELYVGGSAVATFTSGGYNGVIGGTTPAAITGTTITGTTLIGTTSGRIGSASSSSPTFGVRRESGTTAPLFEVEAAIGSFTGTSIQASNTLESSASFDLFRGVTDSDGDGSGASTVFKVNGLGSVNVTADLAIQAGGAAGYGLLFGSTTNFGIFVGSGAPTLSAAQGSLYLRSDGSSTSTRLYVNTNGSTTWTNVTTAA